MRMVSGTLSLPSRGAFHLSLTVLSAIGHQVVFSLGRWSARVPTGFLVSGGTLESRLLFQTSLTGLSPSSAGFSNTVQLARPSVMRVRTPQALLPAVWAVSLSFATT